MLAMICLVHNCDIIYGMVWAIIRCTVAQPTTTTTMRGHSAAAASSSTTRCRQPPFFCCCCCVCVLSWLHGPTGAAAKHSRGNSVPADRPNNTHTPIYLPACSIPSREVRGPNIQTHSNQKKTKKRSTIPHGFNSKTTHRDRARIERGSSARAGPESQPDRKNIHTHARTHAYAHTHSNPFGAQGWMEGFDDRGVTLIGKSTQDKNRARDNDKRRTMQMMMMMSA